MSTTVKTGWLKDSQGNKFAPKTIFSQVITSDGISLENKIDEDLSSLESSYKEYCDEAIANITSGDTVVQEATHSSTADTATNAENANHAVNADNATSSDSATKATQDASGNVITDTYETKADAVTKINEAKDYTDEQITNHTHSWDELNDKPFYDNSTTQEILPTTSIAFNENGYIAITPENYVAFSSISGTCTVTFNGEQYTGDVQEYYGAYYMDVLKPTGDGRTTTLITINDNNGSYSITKSSMANTEATISITSSQLDIKQIDEKFIPDTIARVEYVELVQDSVGELMSGEAYAMKAYSDTNGNVIVDTYETKTDASTKLTEAKAYADNAANTVKNDLLNGAGGAYDTLKELGALIDTNTDALQALEEVASGKADKEHTHTVSDITDYVAPVQSDWNQNDETALDYVKNRPCYTTDSVETVVMEEQTFNFNADTDNIYEYYAYETTVDLKEGNDYTVVWDGTIYECTCYDMDGSGERMQVGNSDGSFSDYPFRIGTEYPYYITLKTNSTEASHTVKISEYVPSVVKLDEKYLPSSLLNKPGLKVEGKIFTIDNVEVTAGSGAEIFNDYSGQSIATGQYAHTNGYGNIATGNYSAVISGFRNEATGQNSLAGGHFAFAIGEGSIAYGESTKAQGVQSSAIGNGVETYGNISSAEGEYTIAYGRCQHVQGRFNTLDPITDSAADLATYAHIVGNGTSINERSNAHTLDWSGNAWYAGSVEGTALILSSPNGTRFNITVGDDGVLTATEITA